MPLDNDNIPSMVVPMILYRIKESLESSLVDEVPDENPTRAVLIKVGRFQDNPVDNNVSVAISGGDFEDPAYIDGRVDHQDLNDITIKNIPVGEIGGGEYWWRRGSINFQVFFIRQSFVEDVALQYAYDFYGRLVKAVGRVDLNGLRDDYGELVYNLPLVESVSFFESGGPPNKYIWRGKLLFRVLTWREP